MEPGRRRCLSGSLVGRDQGVFAGQANKLALRMWSAVRELFGHCARDS